MLVRCLGHRIGGGLVFEWLWVCVWVVGSVVVWCLGGGCDRCLGTRFFIFILFLLVVVAMLGCVVVG